MVAEGIFKESLFLFVNAQRRLILAYYHRLILAYYPLFKSSSLLTDLEIPSSLSVRKIT